MYSRLSKQSSAMPEDADIKSLHQQLGRKPRLLDLFCGAGGCSVGYARAGFEIVGVDINQQKNYPFEFHQADAMTYPLDGFDVIHASPPCQAYSKLKALHPERAGSYPDLVALTRDRLVQSKALWVMENVPGAPIYRTIMLCGSMFGLSTGPNQLRRHRLFESNVMLLAPSCQHTAIAVGVFGHGSNQTRKNKKGQWRGLQANKQQAVEAMGIDWMTHKELSQAIPPAYTEHIGRLLLQYLPYTSQS